MEFISRGFPAQMYQMAGPFMYSKLIHVGHLIHSETRQNEL